MTARYPASVVRLLDDLETELKKLGYWQDKLPPDDALQSVVPFCYDTLKLTEWIQWLFIPRMKNIVAMDQALPARCEVLPAAELYFQQSQLPEGKLLAIIEELDSAMPEPLVN